MKVFIYFQKKETSAECTEEVYKVIHNRALDFDLNPELDKACRAELGQFCSDNMVERGSVCDLDLE